MYEAIYFELCRRFQMRDQGPALKMEINSTTLNMEIDLDEVIRALEEVAQEIEKVDWEHRGLAGNDA